MARTPPLPPHSPATLPPSSPASAAPEPLGSTSRTPGTAGHLGHVTSHLTMLRGTPGQPSLSASPGQQQGQRSPAEAETDKMGPADPPDPIQTTLISKTICSARRGPRRALGQKEPAPGWPCAGLRGLSSAAASTGQPVGAPGSSPDPP